MGTNNFYNHDNGIYVIPGTMYVEYLNDDIESYRDLSTTIIENFIYELDLFLENKGYELISRGDWTMIYKKNKLVAGYYLKDGYYDGVQIIIETDPGELGLCWDTLEDLYSQYTPNHKRILNLVSKLTIPIIKVGQFSNGEAVYKLR